MKDFIDEKIVVHAKDKNELREFLNACVRNGIIRESIIRVALNYSVEPFLIGLKNGNLTGYKWVSDNREVVPASEFISPQIDIRITSHGKTTVCLKYVNGKVVARGVARCNPDDEWVADFGAKLAFDRMMGVIDLKKEMETGLQNFFLKHQPRVFNCNLKMNYSNADAKTPKEHKIKTLKDGTRIIKKDNYSIGDVIIFKKTAIPAKLERIDIITERSSDGELFKYSGSGDFWWSKDRIKGKVIND